MLKQVKLISCRSTEYWYGGYVGKIFTIDTTLSDNPSGYIIACGRHKGDGLHKDDVDVKYN